MLDKALYCIPERHSTTRRILHAYAAEASWRNTASFVTEVRYIAHPTQSQGCPHHTCTLHHCITLANKVPCLPGSGIAPFFPVPTQPSGVSLPFHLFLFVVRVAIVVPFTLLYFLVLSWLPLGPLGKKAALWIILGVPGVWWIDLAVDGVKKGYLSLSLSLSQPCLFLLT